MQSKSILCLIEILTQQGMDVLNQLPELEHSLGVCCKEQKREINILLSAAREGVPSTLLDAKIDNLNTKLFNQLVIRLIENQALDEKAARWAVQGWAIAVRTVKAQQSYSDPGLEERLMKRMPKVESWHQTRLQQQMKIEEETANYKVPFELVNIPAGEFFMGSNEDEKEAEKAERPQHRIYLPAYRISKYPITVGQYADFIEHSHYQTNAGWSNLRMKINHPVIQVSWYDALAFCEWLSKMLKKKVRLPTEAEWEKAARGSDRRKYPWGNTPPVVSLCNIENNVGDTTPVDRYPQGISPYGCMDMAGNVWEWTSSIFQEYPYIPDDGRESAVSDKARVLRGGAFWIKPGSARCASRFSSIPDINYNYFGFRVVIPPS